jgi:hypothetical protein
MADRSAKDDALWLDEKLRELNGMVRTLRLQMERVWELLQEHQRHPEDEKALRELLDAIDEINDHAPKN